MSDLVFGRTPPRSCGDEQAAPADVVRPAALHEGGRVEDGARDGLPLGRRLAGPVQGAREAADRPDPRGGRDVTGQTRPRHFAGVDNGRAGAIADVPKLAPRHFAVGDRVASRHFALGDEIGPAADPRDMDLKRTAPTTNPVDEAAGVVLFRAHERLREVENWLELEAADPRVCPLYRQAKALRKSVAAVLVEVALTTKEG